jgi:hypothetical protein
VTTEENRRGRLGGIIEREVGRRWRTKIQAEQEIRVSHATLHRVTTGQPVGPVVLDKVELGLGLPRHLLQHFIDGDRAEVESMPIDPASPGWDADLKRVFLKALDTTELTRNEGSIQTGT